MDTPATGPTTIIAATSDEPRHEPVRRRAASIARDAGSTVIPCATPRMKRSVPSVEEYQPSPNRTAVARTPHLLSDSGGPMQSD
jgi:hypothetical protein